MRTAILGWFLGLLSIGALTGCESLRSLREGACGSTRSRGDQCVLCQEMTKKTNSVNAEPFPINAKIAATANAPGKHPILDLIEKPAEPDPNQRTTAAAVKLEEAVAPWNIGTLQEEEIDPSELSANSDVAKTIGKISDTEAVKPAAAVLVGSPKKDPFEIMSAKIQDVPVKAFESITGNVQPWRKTWRLRFAPVDQEAVYGGSVVLEGIGLDRLRDGQTVRVQGVLIAPTERASPARYRVQTLEILD
jgi:hypothetical protein